MSENEVKTPLQEAEFSLIRIQEFDCEQLPRVEDLGSALNFSDAVKPAKRLISLYKRLTIVALQDFPEKFINSIRSQCDADYQKFQQILDFDHAKDNLTHDLKQQWIEQIKNSYDVTFNVLHPFISYSLHRSADFQRLDAESRATFQKIQDESKQLQGRLGELKDEAEGILVDIRSTAAEQGVTQQAIYFKDESEEHDTEANKWETRTKWLSFIVAIYAIASLFIHKWNWIAPQNTFETVQLVVSKLLIFSVLVYLLILSAKNYLNHRHNSIVNKHRQNALMTYKALVDAAGDEGAKEAVLIQAAGCIFNPQSTGYTGHNESSVSGRSLVEILSKPAVQAATNATK